MHLNEFTDGHYGTFDEVEGGGTVHPFKNRQVKDITTYIRRRIYEGERSAFTPADATLADPDDAGALLLEESELEDIGGDIVRVIREFGPVPLPQIRMDMRKFARPPMHDLFVPGGLGYVYAVSFDQLITSHLFFTRKPASIGAPATTYLTLGNQLAVLAHQQVSITLNSGTAIFYLDDTDAAIKDALSTAWTGNTSGAGFFYVGRWQYGLRLTWAGASVTVRAINISSAEIAIGANTLTFGVASNTGPVEIVTAQTVLTSVRPVSCAGHAGVSGNRVALFNNDRLLAISTVAVAIADAFSIPTKDLPDKDAVVTHIAFDKDGLRLVNGTKDCTVRQTENYFRAGVTVGINTLADVPPVTTYEDPIAWLGRIAATTLTGCTAAAATNLLGKPDHGLSTGDIFFILDKGIGAAGLATLVLYWAIKIDADHWKAAASAEDAKDGIALGVGSGSAGMKILVPAPWPAITVSQFQAYKGPVVFKTTEEIQMADALVTRAPTG